MNRYRLILRDFENDIVEVVRIRTKDTLEVMGDNTIILGQTIITTSYRIEEIEEKQQSKLKVAEK